MEEGAPAVRPNTVAYWMDQIGNKELARGYVRNLRPAPRRNVGMGYTMEGEEVAHTGRRAGVCKYPAGTFSSEGVDISGRVKKCNDPDEPRYQGSKSGSSRSWGGRRRRRRYTRRRPTRRRYTRRRGVYKRRRTYRYGMLHYQNTIFILTYFRRRRR
jgi:hypothetical protein